MDKLYSIHFADNVNLRLLKADIDFTLIGETNVELFYKTSGNKYLSIYNYGAVAFMNFSDPEIEFIMRVVKAKSRVISSDSVESININFGSDKTKFKENTLSLNSDFKSKDMIYRIIMFDISQSVALDYYSKIGDTLLGQINQFAGQLEEKGDLNLSKKEIMKFIGKSLITKNNIVDTLYIFDSPDITWEDEGVDKLHNFLVGIFDLKSRYHEIETIFKVVDENLETFRDLYQHKISSNMEIIVIILIAIEILNIALERLHFFK